MLRAHPIPSPPVWLVSYVSELSLVLPLVLVLGDDPNDRLELWWVAWEL